MFRAVALIVLSLGAAAAHDVITTKITWSKEISRLVYKRCVSCHRDRGGAFPLMTYEQARPWAKAIKEEVLERRMPPWNIVKGFGEFRDDRGLTQEEIELISDWVEGGAPEGDPTHLPGPPAASGWRNIAAPAGASELVVSAGTRIQSPARVVAVRPKNLQPGTTAQIIAVSPDGTVEPVLWVYQYNPRFKRTYYYRAPLVLPAGTRIEVSPATAGSVSLFKKPVA